ncbi:pre-mRNA-splicing factor CWC22, putative [Plasmodium ovale]|uniref:Pre-mRNA-splicing factor CWC22, putative n=1 Tax=Plasmodium ovale TaxID=36330 RepID=A0A1C3L5W6_PLAOA|nr:pre-mRNA-splicing factor CWC22, putative [Plasmodium ovale]
MRKRKNENKNEENVNSNSVRIRRDVKKVSLYSNDDKDDNGEKRKRKKLRSKSSHSYEVEERRKRKNLRSKSSHSNEVEERRKRRIFKSKSSNSHEGDKRRNIDSYMQTKWKEKKRKKETPKRYADDDDRSNIGRDSSASGISSLESDTSESSHSSDTGHSKESAHLRRKRMKKSPPFEKGKGKEGKCNARYYSSTDSEKQPEIDGKDGKGKARNNNFRKTNRDFNSEESSGNSDDGIWKKKHKRGDKKEREKERKRKRSDEGDINKYDQKRNDKYKEIYKKKVIGNREEDKNEGKTVHNGRSKNKGKEKSIGTQFESNRKYNISHGEKEEKRVSNKKTESPLSNVKRDKKCVEKNGKNKGDNKKGDKSLHDEMHRDDTGRRQKYYNRCFEKRGRKTDTHNKKNEKREIKKTLAYSSEEVSIERTKHKHGGSGERRREKRKMSRERRSAKENRDDADRRRKRESAQSSHSSARGAKKRTFSSPSSGSSDYRSKKKSGNNRDHMEARETNAKEEKEKHGKETSKKRSSPYEGKAVYIRSSVSSRSVSSGSVTSNGSINRRSSSVSSGSISRGSRSVSSGSISRRSSSVSSSMLRDTRKSKNKRNKRGGSSSSSSSGRSSGLSAKRKRKRAKKGSRSGSPNSDGSSSDGNSSDGNSSDGNSSDGNSSDGNSSDGEGKKKRKRGTEVQEKEYDPFEEDEGTNMEINEDLIEYAKKKIANVTTEDIGRSGGVYIPPFKLERLQNEVTNKKSNLYQKHEWMKLKKKINNIVNKVNVDNIGDICYELFECNLIRGKGIFSRAILHAQLSSPAFTNVFACLLCIVNSKFPNIGLLTVHRIILHFRRAYKRCDKILCFNSVKFIAHMINQRMLHEIVGLQLCSLLLQNITNDSVQVCTYFLTEVGQLYMNICRRGIDIIFDRLKDIIQEGKINIKTQYDIEKLWNHRKNHFSDFPTVIEELDIIDDETKIIHEIDLLDETFDNQEELNIFREVPYEQYEEENIEWENICNELLHGFSSKGGEKRKKATHVTEETSPHSGSSSHSRNRSESSTDSENGNNKGDNNGEMTGNNRNDSSSLHSTSESSDDSEEESEEGEGEDEDGDADADADAEGTEHEIKDMTKQYLINLRKNVYLSIMSSLSFEECVHKLLKLNIKKGYEIEICNMLIDCCCMEKTFQKFYALQAERLCKLNKTFQENFEKCFENSYNTAHRLETAKLRNCSKLFAHLLYTDAISWSIFIIIKLTEEDTTSSTRIFIKILLQELTNNLGLKMLYHKINHPAIAPFLIGLFPVDNAQHIRFSINFFTAIGLGALTTSMRKQLLN